MLDPVYHMNAGLSGYTQVRHPELHVHIFYQHAASPLFVRQQTLLPNRL